ncbi:MAG TPA: ABC transporter permease [Gemmatimonadaceae bacterium]|nr:ABC transporter permease [Gemmatimonadaceae bacterium]
MTRPPNRPPLAVRIYGALLGRLLPRKLREEFADEMTLVFADLQREAARAGGGRGVWAGFVALVRELPGLVRLTIRERRDSAATHAGIAHLDERSGIVLDSLMQDLRYAARSLRRSPGFTLVAVLTLALGVGANTAIFSVIDGVLLRPLPYLEPDRLIAVGEGTMGGSPTDMSSTSPGSFFDWRRQTNKVRLAGYSPTQGTVTGGGDPEHLSGLTAIGGLFEVLGVRPLLGRPLVESDETPAEEPVIVLGHPAWRRFYGEDSAAVGRLLTLNGTSRLIVGVMPPGFRFPDADAEFWIPARFDAGFRGNRDQYFIRTIGRLAPGATIDQARNELVAIGDGLRRDWPMYNSNLSINARPLRDTIVGDVRARLLVLMGAVAFVLLITCANLGNLLLARASVRRHEMAVRRALGAGRARVARQLLTESLVLAVAGGAAGLLAGKAFLSLLLAAQTTTNLPRAHAIALDHRVLLFTLGISLAAGIMFGMFPAWQLGRAHASEALRTGARTIAGRQWARNVLVVSQLALAMVLLSGAGLLLRSFALLQGVDPGFTGGRILTFDVALRESNFDFFPETLERIRAIPGVRSAATVSQFPITGRGVGAWFNRLDRPLPAGVTPPGEAYRVVTPEYFETIGLPLRRGRLLGTEDRRERPGVVINEALARKHYAGEEPVGREIYLGAPDNRLFERATIVGVVGDTRDAGLGSDPLPTVYIPLAVMPWWRFSSYVIRTAGPAVEVAAAARAVIREADPGLAIRNVRTLDDVLAESVAPARWSMTLLGVFAAVALVMATLGVFGVLSFVVTQRTRELGICIALGAAPGTVRRMVVGQGLRLIAAGVVLGLAGALALTRLMEGLLYGVPSTDPVTYAGVAAVLVGIAVVASYFPARRATRIDPMMALRSE